MIGASEPRATSGGAVDSVVQLLKHINLGGLPAAAWTVVVCVALWKQDGTTLRWLWPQLLTTWRYLVGFWVLFTFGAMLFEHFKKGRELVPVVAHPGPRGASAAPSPGPLGAERAANE